MNGSGFSRSTSYGGKTNKISSYLDANNTYDDDFNTKPDTKNWFLSIFIEFIGTLILSSVFCSVFSSNGGASFEGSFAIAATITFLQSIMVKHSGGYFNPTFVLASFIVSNVQSVGFTVLIDFGRVFRMIFFQTIASIIGCLLMSFITGSDPVFLEYSGLLISGFTAELIGVFVITFVFLYVVDDYFGYQARIKVLHNIENSNNRKSKITYVREIRQYHAVWVGLAHFSIDSTINYFSNGVLNTAIGVGANLGAFFQSLFTIPNTTFLINALWYLIPHFLGSVLAAIVFIMFKKSIVRKKK